MESETHSVPPAENGSDVTAAPEATPADTAHSAVDGTNIPHSDPEIRGRDADSGRSRSPSPSVSEGHESRPKAPSFGNESHTPDRNGSAEDPKNKSKKPSSSLFKGFKDFFKKDELGDQHKAEMKRERAQDKDASHMVSPDRSREGKKYGFLQTMSEAAQGVADDSKSFMSMLKSTFKSDKKAQAPFTLEIQGGDVHTSPLFVLSFSRNPPHEPIPVLCAWYRVLSDDLAVPLELIEGASGGSYQPTIEDIGYRIHVVAEAITEDPGLYGLAHVRTEAPIQLDPNVESEIHDLVQANESLEYKCTITSVPVAGEMSPVGAPSIPAFNASQTGTDSTSSSTPARSPTPSSQMTFQRLLTVGPQYLTLKHSDGTEERRLELHRNLSGLWLPRINSESASGAAELTIVWSEEDRMKVKMETFQQRDMLKLLLSCYHVLRDTPTPVEDALQDAHTASIEHTSSPHGTHDVLHMLFRYREKLNNNRIIPPTPSFSSQNSTVSATSSISSPQLTSSSTPVTASAKRFGGLFSQERSAPSTPSQPNIPPLQPTAVTPLPHTSTVIAAAVSDEIMATEADSAVNALIGHLEAEIARLQSELSQVNTDLTKAQEQSEMLSTQVEAQQWRRDEMKTQLEAVENEKRKLETDKTTLQSAMSELENEKNEIKDELRRAKKEKEKISSELETQRSQVVSLKEELDSQKQLAQAMLAQAQSAQTGASDAVEQLRESLTMKWEEEKRQREQTYELELNTLKEEVESLKTELENQKQDRETVEWERNSLKKKVDSLAKDLKQALHATEKAAASGGQTSRDHTPQRPPRTQTSGSISSSGASRWFANEEDEPIRSRDQDMIAKLQRENFSLQEEIQRTVEAYEAALSQMLTASAREVESHLMGSPERRDSKNEDLARLASNLAETVTEKDEEIFYIRAANKTLAQRVQQLEQLVTSLGAEVPSIASSPDSKENPFRYTAESLSFDRDHLAMVGTIRRAGRPQSVSLGRAVSSSQLLPSPPLNGSPATERDRMVSAPESFVPDTDEPTAANPVMRHNIFS